MKWLNALWVKTKKIASLYTGTFIFVMFINQLLFFGLCLNPICLIAAMPHVLLITVVLGTLINKLSKNPSVDKEAHKNNTRSSKSIYSHTEDGTNSTKIPTLDRLVNFAESFDEKAAKFEKDAEAYKRRTKGEINRLELEALRARAKASIVNVPESKKEPKQIRPQSKKDELFNKIASDENSQDDHVERGGGPNTHSVSTVRKEVGELTYNFNDELHKLNISKNDELSKLGNVGGKNRLAINPQGDSSELLQQKKHQRVQLAKSKHYINTKYKLRQTILKHKKNVEAKNEKEQVATDLLSTTMLCKANGIKSTSDFFKYLIEYELLFFKDKKYHLTDKGKLFGGRYRTNGQGERWVVWSSDDLHTVLCNFKRPLFDRLNINYLMHITHTANLPGILSKGLLPHNNKAQKVDISNSLVNARRAKKEPIHKHSIHDYVPFYFNVRNAMLFQVQKEFGAEVIILSFYKEAIASPKTIFSNGNASTIASTFTPYIHELASFNWSAIFSSSWKINGVVDLDLKSKMMSECLIYEKVAIDKLHCIYCQDIEVQQRIIKVCEDKKIHINVAVDPMLFF